MSETTELPILPSPDIDQAYMTVSALEGGHLNARVASFLAGASETERITMPSLAFFLTHSKTGTNLVFDLGIRRELDTYPPAVRNAIMAVSPVPVQVEQDVSESLIKGGVNLDDVSYVILSHLHFDHIGYASWFPKSTFIIGEAARKLLQDAYPRNPNSQFLDTSVPNDRQTRFLSDTDFSSSIGEFSRACDLFGDGSLYVIDAPGHLEGHINVLARTSSTGGWIILGGDSCHHNRLFEDGKFAYRTNERGEIVDCVHADKDVAEAHLERVKRLRNMKQVQVLIAHDTEWYNANKGGASFLPGHIHPRA